MIVLNCRDFLYQEKYIFFEVNKEKIDKMRIPEDEEN
jgi:hypothetical protein